MTDYGPSDTSTTTLGDNQFPISEAYVPNIGLRAVEGGPVTTDANGKQSAPMGVYAKDGGDVAQGLTTDPAVTGDTSGTLSAKLRGQLKIFTDVWDSTNHLFHVNLKQVAGAAISLANPVPVQAQRLEISGLSAGPGSGTNLVLLNVTDVSNYKWYTVHLTGTWTGNIVFWTGNTSTVSDMHHNIMELSGGISGGVNPGFSFSLNDVYTGRIVGRYIYIDCEPLNSGTVNAVVELWATPPPYLTANALLTPSNNFIGFLKNGVVGNARYAPGVNVDTLIHTGGGAPSIIGTVIINTSGTAQLDLYDAGITPIPTANPIMASIPANAAPGPYVFNTYCQFGIGFRANTNNPGFSISFS